MGETIVKTNKIISYLSFVIGDEHFALNVGRVINILEMQSITKVPKTPEYVRGIINLRGEVLPIIDTNTKLGLGETVKTANTCILVIESDYLNSKIRFGILVDSVQEVLEIEDKYILKPPTLGDKFKAELITGMVEHNDKFIMIININKLLDIKDVRDIENINQTI